MASPLPTRPEEVSAAWLTAALREEGHEIDVREVSVADVRHGTNSNARLRLSVDPVGALPETAFLKLPPLDPERREAINATGMGRREALFYQHLAAHVPMRVPRPYLARFDETSGAFVLLIEDLEGTACTIPDPHEGLSVAQTRRGLRDFAALHVRYEDATRRKREAAWVEPMPRGSQFGTQMLQFGLDHHRARIADAFAEIAALYIAEQAALEEAWERGPMTVLQGDSHIGNLFVDGDRPGFLDWGLIQRGSPIRDVGYFLTMALTPELRRAHERELLAEYLEARVQLGGAAIGFDRAWELHRVHAAYAVPAACPLVLFPDDQTPEAAAQAAAFLERSQRVVEDLDVRAALRDFVGI